MLEQSYREVGGGRADRRHVSDRSVLRAVWNEESLGTGRAGGGSGLGWD